MKNQSERTNSRRKPRFPRLERAQKMKEDQLRFEWSSRWEKTRFYPED